MCQSMLPAGGPSRRLPRYGDRRRQTIGLLGGSFNPAHAGHWHIAREALRRLGVDQVWLLVSPGSPLKHAAGMAPLSVRLASADAISGDPRVIATDIERYLRTRFTLDTLRALKQLFPRTRFIWLMGADNLAQFPRWKRWMDIARTVPFAILPRPTYTRCALAGQAARRLASARRPGRQASLLASLPAPAWVFLDGRQNAISATALRKAAAGENRSPGSLLPPQARGPKSRNAARQNRPPS